MAILENPYLRDARYFLARAIEGISEEKEGPENASHALDLALGVERLLKGVLWNQHPGFTLMDDKFENITRVFHADRLKKIGASTEKGNADSITYRAAATRARVFCDATHEHFSVLMRLGQIRDIIAHNDLALLDLKDTAFFLRRNLHPILASFGAQKLFDATKLMGEHEPQLAKMAFDYIEDLKERVSKRLAHHLEVFKARKTVTTYVHPTVTKRRDDQMETEVMCPACGQTAIVREEVDFDVVDGKAQPLGVFILHLRCPYCRMFVEDYEELEEMGITEETLHSWPDDE